MSLTLNNPGTFNFQIVYKMKFHAKSVVRKQNVFCQNAKLKK